MRKTATIKEENLFADFERLSKKRKKEVSDFVAYLILAYGDGIWGRWCKEK